MNNTSLLGGLIKHIKNKNIRMHMPGHKAGRLLFKGLSAEEILAMDVTELDNTDNLIEPEGIIKKTQELIAQTFGAYHSFLLVGGSTLGVLSMLTAALSEGDEVVMDRNCHISAFSALALTGAKPIFVSPPIISSRGVYKGVRAEDVEAALNKCKNPQAVFITSPNVFGICADLDAISALCKKRGVLLLVDEAHGAHFCFHRSLPKTALQCGADMCTQSFHKTLPALTQTAVLHTANKESAHKASRAIKLFQSTSPSYLLMASMDSARQVMCSEGEKRLSGLIKTINDNAPENLLTMYNKDILRLVIKCDGQRAKNILAQNKILPEMITEGTVVCIVTAADEPCEVLKVLKAAQNLPVLNKSFKSMPRLNLKLLPRKAYYSEERLVNLHEAGGLVAKEAVYLYPPGIPIIAPGEEISGEMVEYLKNMEGYKLLGTKNGKISVVK